MNSALCARMPADVPGGGRHGNRRYLAAQGAADDQAVGVLMRRADALMGCTEGRYEKRELKAITDAVEAYEVVRRPEGKIPGGKGSIRE